jgi:hypothetical protein
MKIYPTIVGIYLRLAFLHAGKVPTMKHIFSLRLSQETDQILQILAEKTFRSRSGVIRLLIYNAALHQGLLTPEGTFTADEISTSETTDSFSSGLKGGQL